MRIESNQYQAQLCSAGIYQLCHPNAPAFSKNSLQPEVQMLTSASRAAHSGGGCKNSLMNSPLRTLCQCSHWNPKKSLCGGGAKRKQHKTKGVCLARKLTTKLVEDSRQSQLSSARNTKTSVLGSLLQPVSPGIFLMQQDRHDEPTKNNPKLNMNIKIQAIFPNHIM
jgi:hypothetical protein